MAVLPIVTYNDPLLRKKTVPVRENEADLQQLIDDMFETMYHAQGVGLAGPQIGRLLQIFVMNADPVTEELDEPDLGPLVCINPTIVEQKGELVELEEGCLSIPEVRDRVKRPEQVRLRWLDRELNTREMTLDGWVARVAQHEYDHLQGKLFLDYLSAFRLRLHKSRLTNIDSGNQPTEYPLVSRSDAISE